MSRTASPTALVRGGLIAWSFAALLLAKPARADATTKTTALSWVRLPDTETCISATTLGARIEDHVGRGVLVSPSVADMSIEGRIESVVRNGKRRYHAVIGGSRRDGTTIGSRELDSQGADCTSLDDSLVLAIALMIDPEATSPRSKNDASPTRVEPRHDVVVREVIVREVVHEKDHVTPDEASKPWIVDASLGGGVAIERLPGIAATGSLALRAGPSSLTAFEASFGGVPASTLDAAAVSVRYTLLEGGLAYCPTKSISSRFDAGACAGLRLGNIHSRGKGLSGGTETDRFFADIAFGPRVTLTVTAPVFVTISGAILVPTVRERTVAMATSGELLLHERSGVGGELGLAVGVRFSP